MKPGYLRLRVPFGVAVHVRPTAAWHLHILRLGGELWPAALRSADTTVTQNPVAENFVPGRRQSNGYKHSLHYGVD